MSRPEVGDDESPSRQRILAATAEVLARTGQTRLSLSEVAAQAGVSRPTLYRWFASKSDLLEAFSSHEMQAFENGLNRITAGLGGEEKLSAALEFVVEYQQSYSAVRLVEVEPDVALDQIARVLPAMRTGLQQLLPGPGGALKAATATRVLLSHFVVRADDDDQLLAQLRNVVGLKPVE